MNVSELRTKIRNLLAAHPEMPNGEILGTDAIHDPFGLEITVPTEISGINQVFRIFVQEDSLKENAPLKRLKSVETDDGEHRDRVPGTLVDPHTWLRRPMGPGRPKGAQ